MLLDAYVRMGDPRAVQIMAAMSGVAVDVGIDDMEEAEAEEKILDTEEDLDNLKEVDDPVDAKRIGTTRYSEQKYERAIKAYRRALKLLVNCDDEMIIGEYGAATLHAHISLCELKQHNWR